ncbi:hypothetical protein [Gimesia chilikensis]|uniref:hypothetical protein n=1 Tax=Gimesia chilikensis TaxID=2605989 RepID=UPI00118C8FB7|nr:hypothetical protein [Gimesia chilikensis]QDT82430.1 hypothetical protein MalM14_00570 [Gimesia chilikensis]
MNVNQTPTTLDRQLARLADETTLAERFDILKTLVEYWHGAIQAEDALTENELSEIAMPAALKKWYLWAGKRKSIMSGQNHFFDPSRLHKHGNHLVFHLENQGCFEWATAVEEEDPPVFGREDELDPWQPQNLRLSEHLIQTCLFEAITCHAKYSATVAWLEETKVAFFREHIPKIPISPWTWLEEIRFFAGQDRFMYTIQNGEYEGIPGYNVWIASKKKEPLQFAKEMIDETWDYVSL